jgi:hypothetical protein
MGENVWNKNGREHVEKIILTVAGGRQEHNVEDKLDYRLPSVRTNKKPQRDPLH